MTSEPNMTHEDMMEFVLSLFTDINKTYTTASLSRDHSNKIGKQGPGILLELAEHGLLTMIEKDEFKNNLFSISSKGCYILENGGVHVFLKEIREKESLERKVLRATDQSYILNKLHLFFTAILAIGTIASLIIQCKSY